MALRHIISGSGAWPLHGVSASRRAEAAALSASPPPPLMQRAGLSLARLAVALQPHAHKVRVHAGPGNNGGDGFVAAALLVRMGRAVDVVFVGSPERLPPDAAHALSVAQALGVAISTSLDSSSAPDLHIDALLGLGAGRAAEGMLAQAIRGLNASPVPVISADLPSALNADTGMALGGLAVRATATLSMLTLKPGLFTGTGRDHAGDIWFDDLDVDAGAPDADLTASLAPLEPRLCASHKGSFGDVAVVGGASGMVGAAVLAARAALTCGAGRVYCSLLDDDHALIDGGRPELMFRRQWWQSTPAVLAASTVVCGCGGGEGVATALPPLLTHAARLILDADALNAMAVDSQWSMLLMARANRGLRTVITPHPLEAARLLQTTTGDVQSDRLGAASELASKLQCVVVLKGSGTCIASPGRRPALNVTGNALLATAGTGDVLAGWTAGLWSQGVSAWDAACRAAWQHGHAADLAAKEGRTTPLLADDLIRRMTGEVRPTSPV
jgi:hydroxyethylthiazole kinase-like uncharacterized protein yjeF